MSQPPEGIPPNIRIVPPPGAAGRPPGKSLLEQVAEGIQAWRSTEKQNRLVKELVTLAHAFSDYALPPPYERLLLDGEKVLLEIRQAYYRNKVPSTILKFWWLVLAATAAVGLLLFHLTASWAVAALVILLPLLIFAWALTEQLHFHQWRLIITDKRTIIYMPDPDSWWRVDHVRMGGPKKIAVVDANFSRSAWWGIFQTITGARDLVISISGYAFKANRAEVQGGLTFPDVMPQDIRKLEEIIFK